MLSEIYKKLKELAKNSTPETNSRFFKTDPNGYSAHDVFLGLRMPDLRSLAKNNKDLNLANIKKLLGSKYNEYRSLGLIILTEQYKASKSIKIRKFYLENIKQVNNWNLVDISAHSILGDPLDIKLLKKLSKSKNLWERRVSMVATWGQIKLNNTEPTFDLAKLFLKDPEDLIHKATGWMLREAGKKNLKSLEDFLDKYAHKMPRTMLRYAIERFDRRTRTQYLQKSEAQKRV